MSINFIDHWKNEGLRKSLDYYIDLIFKIKWLLGNFIRNWNRTLILLSQ